MSKYPIEVQKKIVEQYAEGVSSSVLVSEWGVCHQTIINYVRKHGGIVRNTNGRLTQAQVEAIGEAYASGLSSGEVAERFGVTASGVITIVTRLGIPRRKRNDYPPYRKNSFNERFFAEWTPDMAYVLGFAFADGTLNVDEGRRNHRLTLDQKDPGILYDIAQTIGYTGELGTTHVYSLKLNSKAMVRDLLAIGMTPNKVNTMHLPAGVQYPADFVRGYFDGDGHGGRYQRRTGERVLRIGFSSNSKAFLVELIALLPARIGGPYKCKGRGFSLQTSAEANAVAIRDWMYQGESALHIPSKKSRLY